MSSAYLRNDADIIASCFSPFNPSFCLLLLRCFFFFFFELIVFFYFLPSRGCTEMARCEQADCVSETLAADLVGTLA